MAFKERMHCGRGFSAEVESSFRIHTVISLVLSTTHTHTHRHTKKVICYINLAIIHSSTRNVDFL